MTFVLNKLEFAVWFLFLCVNLHKYKYAIKPENGFSLMNFTLWVPPTVIEVFGSCLLQSKIVIVTNLLCPWYLFVMISLLSQTLLWQKILQESFGKLQV